MEQLAQILTSAYGEQADDVVRQVWRGLSRAGAQLEAGDLARAALEAVSIGLPDLDVAAMAKLSSRADLEKGGEAWENEPRVPAGQREGGQWTTGGATGGASPSGGRASGPRIAR